MENRGEEDGKKEEKEKEVGRGGGGDMGRVCSYDLRRPESSLRKPELTPESCVWDKADVSPR